MSVHLIHPSADPRSVGDLDAGKPGWPNVLWPTLRRTRVGALGEIGRLLHWTGVIAAGLCVLLAIEFLVEGWATHLSRDLLCAALALIFGARALRWMMTRE